MEECQCVCVCLCEKDGSGTMQEEDGSEISSGFIDEMRGCPFQCAFALGEVTQQHLTWSAQPGLAGWPPGASSGGTEL